MIVYMVHPDHGTHVAYDLFEVERNKLNGWTVREDSSREVADAHAEGEKQEPKKRGRPRKAK